MKRRNISNRLSYGNLFEDREIALAKGVVRDFCGAEKYFDGGEFNDLLQECIIHWWRVEDRYNSSQGASRRTFMRTVLRSKLIDLVRERKASKRKPSYNTCSLDKPLKDDEDSSTYVDELDESCSPFPSLFQCSDIDLKIDLANTLEKLTTRQYELCQLFMEGRDVTVFEVSEILQTSRSTIYDEIQRIQKLFKKDDFWE